MATQARQPVRLLVFPASLRTDSLNRRLAELAADTIAANGAEGDLAAMAEFVTPAYDEDVQARDGFPEGAEELRDRITASDAFVISSPEYNASMPGMLWALRVPFEHLGARVYPDMFSLAQAHQAFDGAGQIANEQLRERFEHTITGFIDLVEASKHYPCVKTRWVEYLGEHPDPVLDRVE
jgi:NAD(P)H-dependent FMN reductase